MRTDRLPPALLLALGLGCGPAGSPDDGGGEGTGGGTTGAPSTEGTTGATDGGLTSSSSVDQETSVSPCLFDLGNGRDDFGSDSSTGGSDSTTSSGSGSDTGSTGGTDTSAEVLQRLFASGVLPPDVARKLAGDR